MQKKLFKYYLIVSRKSPWGLEDYQKNIILHPRKVIPLFLTEPCGRVRDGGFSNCQERRMKQLKKLMYNEESCREECRNMEGCGVFLVGKEGGIRAGHCYLYTPGSENLCTNGGEDAARIWTIYLLKECQGSKFGVLFHHFIKSKGKNTDMVKAVLLRLISSHNHSSIKIAF